jgi:hypothetical protein
MYCFQEDAGRGEECATLQKRFCLQLFKYNINPLKAELNPIRHLLALVGARHIVHVSRVRVKT